MIWLIGCTKKEYLESVCTSRNYLFGTSILTVFVVAPTVLLYPPPWILTFA